LAELRAGAFRRVGVKVDHRFVVADGDRHHALRQTAIIAGLSNALVP
jgi:hypothetical protein